MIRIAVTSNEQIGHVAEEYADQVHPEEDAANIHGLYRKGHPHLAVLRAILAGYHPRDGIIDSIANRTMPETRADGLFIDEINHGGVQKAKLFFREGELAFAILARSNYIDGTQIRDYEIGRGERLRPQQTFSSFSIQNN